MGIPLFYPKIFADTKYGEICDPYLLGLNTGLMEAGQPNTFLRGGNGTGFSVLRNVNLVGAHIDTGTTTDSADIFVLPLNSSKAVEDFTHPTSPPVIIDNIAMVLTTPILITGGGADAAVLTLIAEVGLAGAGMAANAGVLLNTFVIGPASTPSRGFSGGGGNCHFGTASNDKRVSLNENVGGADSKNNVGPNDWMEYDYAQRRLFISSPCNQLAAPQWDRLVFSTIGTYGGGGGHLTVTSGVMSVYITGRILPSF